MRNSLCDRLGRISVAVLLTGAVGAHAQAPPPPAEGAGKEGAASAAQANFKTKCLMCHGPDGSGSTATGRSLKVPDLRTSLQKKTDAEVVSQITDGKNKMPPFKTKLSKEEIDALVAYVRGLAPKE